MTDLTDTFTEDQTVAIRVVPFSAKGRSNTYTGSTKIAVTVPTIPAQMSAPTVSAVTQVNGEQLSVDRAADPDDGGSTILRFDLRHSTDEATWTEVEGIAAADEIIAGLPANTLHYVQTRAVNAIGTGTWSASGTATTTVAAPTAGGTIAQQNLFNRVALGSNLDITSLFSGGGTLTYDVDLTAGDGLPNGLTVSSAGVIPSTDKPVGKTNPAELPNVYFRASNEGGSFTAATPVVFSVDGPILAITNVTSNNVTISTDDPNSTDTIHWAFCSILNPDLDELVAGTGTGILISGSFAANEAGDDMDLTDEVGTPGYLVAIQVGGASSAYAPGASSNVVSEPLTVQAVAPLGFEAADWNPATGSGTGEIDLTISSLPEDGGAAIDDVEFDYDGNGSWASVPGYAGTGAYTITLPAGGTSYDIRLRAVNSAGNGAPGNTESATSGGSAPLSAPVLLNEVTSSSDSTNPELVFTPSGLGVLVVKVMAMNGVSASAAMTVTSADIGAVGRGDGTGTDAANSVVRHNGRNNSQIYVFPNPGSSEISFEMVTGSLRAHHIEAWEYPGNQAAQNGDSDTEAASTGISQAYSIPSPPAGGFLACCSCMRFENDDTFRWTGVDENYPEWDPGVNELPPTETNAGGSNTNDLSGRTAWKDYGSDNPVTAGVAWTTSATHAGVCIVIEPA